MLFCVLFGASRIAYLDADGPPFNLTFYGYADELYYTITGFNLYNHGSWMHAVFDFLPPDGGPMTGLHSFLTFVGLSIFGNNYYGLRMPAVLAGAVVAGCLIFLVRAERSLHRGRTVVATAILSLYILTDFFFLESNRFSEPTIFCTMAIALQMLFVSVVAGRSRAWTPLASLASGLVSGVTCTFVSVYCVYATVALGLTILVVAVQSGARQAASRFGLFLLGNLLSILIFICFLDVAFHMSPAELYRMITGVASHGGTTRVPKFDGLLEFAAKLISSVPLAIDQSITHNLFRYNPALLLIFLASLPIFLVRVGRERRPLDLFVLLLLCCRFALSVVIPHDWFEKKLLQVFPCVMYVIASAFIFASAVISNEWVTRTSWIVTGYAAFVVVAAIGLHSRAAFEVNNRTPNSGLIALQELRLVALMLPLLLCSGRRLRTLAGVAACCMLLSSNARLAVEFVYGHPTYKRRDALIALSKKVDGRVLAGGLSFGVRPYTTCTPVMNFYQYYYYGTDKFVELSKRLFESGAASGTVLYPPSTPSLPIFARIHEYMRARGVRCDSRYESNEGDGYDYWLYLLPVKNATVGNGAGPGTPVDRKP